MLITLQETKNIEIKDILPLYEANHWSSAQKPDELHKALLNAHSLITAWDGDKLVGLGNALSDGYLVVYYSHLLVLPAYQGKGIGKMIMDKFAEKYSHFHQQILVADGRAIDFYKKAGFQRAGNTEAMWIFQGDEH
jgi:GNAT superfamily N-acetyltransferase